MLKIEIHEHTPANMLRAIKAACDELLKTEPVAVAPTAEQIRASGGAVYQDGEHPAEQTVLATDSQQEVEQMPAEDYSPRLDVDSTGAEWNPELHASTKAKNQDGTWKKRRGSAQHIGTDSKQEVEEMLAEEHSASPALPPLPPVPPAAPLVTMNDIYALITNGKAVLNDVIAAAQAMGFADVGAFSRDATPEQRAQLLQELTA